MSVAYAIYSRSDGTIEVRPRFATFSVGRPLFIVNKEHDRTVLSDAATSQPVCVGVESNDSISITSAGFFANINTTLRLTCGIWTFECCGRKLGWKLEDGSFQCGDIATFSCKSNTPTTPRPELARESTKKSKPSNIQIPYIQAPSPPVTPTLPSPLVTPPTPGLFSPLSPLSSPSKTFSYAQELEAEGYTELGALDISEIALNQRGGRALEIVLVMGLASILAKQADSVDMEQEVEGVTIPIEISL